MPTTPKQIEANRRNASKSTGPRTEEGKAASRGNAVKHGVLAAVVVAQCEDRDAFDALCNDLYSEYQPETRTEAAQVEKLAVLLWRERRLVQKESLMIDAKNEFVDNDPLANFPMAGKGLHQIASMKSLALHDLLLLGRYEVMLSNQILRTLQCLHSLRDRRVKTIDVVVEMPVDDPEKDIC